MKRIKVKEIPITAIKESFHSFEIGDEFDSNDLADLAKNLLSNKQIINVNEINFRKKATSFITGQKKRGVIEATGKSWTTTINGKPSKRKVYRKAGELSDWKSGASTRIPSEYLRFMNEWNNFQTGTALTAEEFHDFLDSRGAPVTYIGQVSKYLWLICDRGLCGYTKIKEAGPNSYKYEKTHLVTPNDLSILGKTLFFKKRVGPYTSVLKLIQNLS